MKDKRLYLLCDSLDTFRDTLFTMKEEKISIEPEDLKFFKEQLLDSLEDIKEYKKGGFKEWQKRKM